VKIPFQKYQGTGNDFVMVDARSMDFHWTDDEIKKICSRKWGVGSDGLILIQQSNQADFRMVFYNPDASQSFCGNGARCAVAFFHQLVMAKEIYSFEAFDGIHYGEIGEDGVSVSMRPVNSGQDLPIGFYCHTGSPHLMVEIQYLDGYDVVKEGALRRYDEIFAPGGTNVNFIENVNGKWHMRTYERGVENETLSCGTGATAVGLYLMHRYHLNSEVQIQTLGGPLTVKAEKGEGFEFNDVYLKGSANFVFSGLW
jgi:diaminopimelate epimerase